MRLGLAGIAALAILAMRPVPAWSVCDVTGEWRHDTPGIGTAVWRLTPAGGGSYTAQEQGLGNAQGTAVVTGNKLRIDWRTGSLTGYYEWTLDPTCRRGGGLLVFTSGRTGTYSSTAVHAGGHAAGPAARDRETITVCDQWRVILLDERTSDRWKGVWRKGRDFTYTANWRCTEGPCPVPEVWGRVVYPIAGGPMAFRSEIPGGRYVYRTSSSSWDRPPGEIEGSWYWEPGGGPTQRGGRWSAQCMDFRGQ